LGKLYNIIAAGLFHKKRRAMAIEKATFGAGCFWCIEAVFQRIKGVDSIVSGYMGGTIKNPAYREICTGRTGHAEVIQLSYDAEIVSFAELLEAFWQTHDPTTLNRQGNDVGTQYRSVVFYHTEEQQQLAEQLKTGLNAQNVFKAPIVTEISAASEFYLATEDHQNYYNDNKNAPYCQFIIVPKLKKLHKVFDAAKLTE